MRFQEAKETVLQELDIVFASVDPVQVDQMAEMIIQAEKVFVCGVGRVLMMMQAFEKRLNHLGIDACYVGEINEPAITDKDVLIVASGSGESVVPVAIVKKAKQFNPKIIHIGSNPNSSMTPYEDLFVRIPCRTKLNLEDEIDSHQIMSSLFEQSVLLLADMTALLIADKKQITDLHALWRKHANIE
ncbi:MAG: SIS domain-containing protein [Erysipelotrichaceae bacterium]|nr:SIS domain-containing protein [Erysipelotrichaceae bacterium]